MVKSMTGYGRARETIGNRDITVELKSVNNRYLDCSVKMPRAYIFAEDAVKNMVQSKVSRGKVDVFVTIDTLAGDEDVVVNVNKVLAKNYYDAIKELDKELELETRISSFDVARFPDVLCVTKKDEDLETISQEICAVLSKAIDAFNDMRATEGEKLAEDIVSRGATIENYVSKVEAKSPETISEYKARLEAKMREVLEATNIDENRILQEVAIYADKIAVDEETVRLRSHIGQLNNLVKSQEPIGRKLDFLVQEMNRECNTIGSKCNNLEITECVVAMKAEVEKIREQVQNIE